MFGSVRLKDVAIEDLLSVRFDQVTRYAGFLQIIAYVLLAIEFLMVFECGSQYIVDCAQSGFVERKHGAGGVESRRP